MTSHPDTSSRPEGVSIILCCHNSVSRLRDTLRHLKSQKVPAEIAWEVVLVDNASSDGTADFANEYWNGTAPTSLNVVLEQRLGLSFARHRGIEVARFEFICFVDDDNWLDPCWIATLYELMSSNPDIGACGGYGEAVCATPAPAWFERFEHSYAVGEQSSSHGDITWTTDWGQSHLWGAGLAVRFSAWKGLYAAGFEAMLTDRKGKALSSGGDYELCDALRLSGWRLWYEPRLRFRHYIPEQRLTWSYLMRLHRGFGSSNPDIDPYRMQFAHGGLSRSRLLNRYWLNQVGRSVLRVGIVIPLKILRERAFYWEGNRHVARWNFELAKLIGIARMRGRYDHQVEAVQKAPWNKLGVFKDEHQ